MSCVPEIKQNANRANKAFERERCTRFHPGAQLPGGGTAAWQTSLILRDLPLKERFTVVDTASIPTPTPLRNPIRARAEKCLLTVRAREESASCRWVLTEKILEL